MKWEYRTVPIFAGTYSDRYPFNPAKSYPLDKLGEDGWVLVSIIQYGTSGDHHLGYFKRKAVEK